MRALRYCPAGGDDALSYMWRVRSEVGSSLSVHGAVRRKVRCSGFLWWTVILVSSVFLSKRRCVVCNIYSTELSSLSIYSRGKEQKIYIKEFKTRTGC